MFDFDTFLEGIRNYGNKAAGCDHWLMAEWAMMPRAVLGPLYHLLVEVRQAGTWPLQIIINLVALLGKPDGGTRGIGLTPMLVRAHDRGAGKLVGQWQEEMLFEIFKGGARRTPSVLEAKRHLPQRSSLGKATPETYETPSGGVCEAPAPNRR